MKGSGTTNPLLTIAIPTFNRSRFLKELLDSLLEQIRNEPRVELIISDNASTDNTSEVVSDFAAQGLSIRYLRNPHNIGADGNFCQCFEQASAKYFWILGDDEVIAPDTIQRLLACLERKEYDLVFVDSDMFRSAPMLNRASEHLHVTEISDPADFARRVNAFFTFISSNIINRDFVLRVASQPPASLIGTSLAQLGWTYAALEHFRKGLYIHEKLIGMRTDNTGGYCVAEVFGSTLVRITTERITSLAVRHGILNGVVQRFWPGILMASKGATARFNDRGRPDKGLTPVFGSNPRYWIFVFPIIVLPPVLARIWHFAVRIVNRLDRAAGYPLLR